MSGESSLRYDRPLGVGGEDSLSVIARMIAPGSTVLDLGASTGRLGLHLREHKGCVVDGVELDPQAALAALPNYRKLVRLDLEQATLAGHFPAVTYDRIVCADVLEHLRDPGRVLDQLPPLLAPGGRLVISIPNIGYAGVVAGLLGAEFQYRPTGLLDTTHLRFFTRKTLLELLARHGFGALHIHPIVVHPAHSEFAGPAFEKLGPVLVAALLDAPDALVYQFVVEAGPGAEHRQRPTGPPQPRARLQAFWAGPEESYDDARSVTTAAPMRDDAVTVELQLPALSAPVGKLRLDLGDRPGYLQLHALSVLSPHGDLLWKWDGDARALPNRHDLAHFSGPTSATWISTAYDPFLELPLPAAALARVSGARIQLQISWPLSSDHAFAISVVTAESDRWEAERMSLAAKAARLEELVRSSAQQQERELGQLRDYGLGLQQQIDDHTRQSLASKEQHRREEAELAGAVRDLRLQQLEGFRATRALSRRTLELEHRQGLRALAREVRRFVLRPSSRMAAVPRSGLRQDGDFWETTGDSPGFELTAPDGRLPTGWTQIEFALEGDALQDSAPLLSADWGEGHDEGERIALPMPSGGVARALVRLPAVVRTLRLDLPRARGRFRLSALEAREIGLIEARLRRAARKY